MLPHCHEEATLNQERRKRLGRQEPLTPIESLDSNSKLIVVLGGESEQGSSVISALLNANSEAFNQATQEKDTTATARSSSKIIDAQSWPQATKTTTTLSSSGSGSNQTSNGGNDIQQQSITSTSPSSAVIEYHHNQKMNHRPSTAPPSTSSVQVVTAIPLSSSSSPQRQRLGPFLDDSFLDTSTPTTVSTPPLSESVGTPSSVDNASPFSISTPLISESTSLDQAYIEGRGDITLKDGMRAQEDDLGRLGLSGVESDSLHHSSNPSSDSSTNASSPPPRIVDIMPSAMNVSSISLPSSNENNQMKVRSSSLGVSSNLPFSLTLPSTLENQNQNRSNSLHESEPINHNHQPPWRVRAILRSNKDNEVDGDIAFQLRARGVELAYVDFDELTPKDGESLEKSLDRSGLTEALEGAWGVLVAPIDRDGYAVGSPVCGFTGFAAPNSVQLTAEEEAERTELRGKLVVDAAARANVTHFIWCCTGDIQRVMNHQRLSPIRTNSDISEPSSETGTTLTASGTVSAHSGYISPTMEHPPLNPPVSILAHAAVQRHINEKVKKKEIQSCSTLAIALPFENFVFSKADGGFYLETSTPTSEPLPFCSSEDTGTCALLAFNSPERYNLSHIDVCSEVTTPQELCAQLTQVIYISSKRVLPFPNVTRADFEDSKLTTFSKDREAFHTLKWLMSWAKSKAGARGGLGSGGRDGFEQAKADYFHSRDPTSSMNNYLASKLIPWRDYATTSVDDLLPSWRDFSNPLLAARKQLPFFQAPERFTHSVHSSLSNNTKGSPSSLNGLSHSLASGGLVASGLTAGINGSCGNDTMSILSLPLPIPASSALPVSAVISSVTNPNLTEPTSILRSGFSSYQGPPLSSPSPSPPPSSPRIASGLDSNLIQTTASSSPSKSSVFSSGLISSDSSINVAT